MDKTYTLKEVLNSKAGTIFNIKDTKGNEVEVVELQYNIKTLKLIGVNYGDYVGSYAELSNVWLNAEFTLVRG